jgi:hypothetical protein
VGARKMARCVILPSIATSIFVNTSEAMLRVRKISFNELLAELASCNEIVNFNRHPPTNQLLAKYFVFTVGTEYRLDKEDEIFIVGLKSRAPVSGQDVAVTVDDLLILSVDILSVS